MEVPAREYTGAGSRNIGNVLLPFATGAGQNLTEHSGGGRGKKRRRGWCSVASGADITPRGESEKQVHDKKVRSIRAERRVSCMAPERLAMVFPLSLSFFSSQDLEGHIHPYW